MLWVKQVCQAVGVGPADRYRRRRAAPLRALRRGVTRLGDGLAARGPAACPDSARPAAQPVEGGRRARVRPNNHNHVLSRSEPAAFGSSAPAYPAPRPRHFGRFRAPSNPSLRAVSAGPRTSRPPRATVCFPKLPLQRRSSLMKARLAKLPDAWPKRATRTAISRPRAPPAPAGCTCTRWPRSPRPPAPRACAHSALGHSIKSAKRAGVSRRVAVQDAEVGGGPRDRVGSQPPPRARGRCQRQGRALLALRLRTALDELRLSKPEPTLRQLG